MHYQEVPEGRITIRPGAKSPKATEDRKQPGGGNTVAITMTRKEMQEFLKEPFLTFIASHTKKSNLHVTPVWSYYDGEHFYITLVDGNPKSRSLARDSRVALAVSSYSLPYKGVVVHGTAELIRGDVRPIVRRIVEKYVGKEQAEAMTDYAMMEPQVIAKVTPQRIYTWDQSKVTFQEVLLAEKSGKAFRIL